MGLGHTGQLLYPVTLLAAWDGLVVDATGEQGRVGGAEVERSSWLQLLRLRVVDKPRELERHEGLVERAVAVRQSFPEWSRPRRGDGLEAQAHQPRDGRAQQIGRDLSDDAYNGRMSACE